jgi:type I restriction enzyme S subunit
VKPGWTQVALGDVCEVRKGTTITEAQATPGEIPVVAGGMKPAYYHSQANRDAGAVTVSASGANAGFVNYWNEPIFASDCTTVEPQDEAVVDRGFVFWQLKQKEVWIQRSLRRGAAQPHVYAKDLSEVQVVLPPLDEQKRIAAILDKADDILAKRRSALAHLDSLTQAIFTEMFGNLEIGDASWPVEPLGELVDPGDKVNYGVVQPGEQSDDGVPLVRVSDFRGGRIDHRVLKRISPEIESKYHRSRLRGDEVLLSCVGTIGLVAVASENECGMNIARAVTRIPPGSSVTSQYLAHALRSPTLQRRMNSEVRTVAQPTLNVKQVKELLLPVPPLDLQQRFEISLGVARSVADRAADLEAHQAELGIQLQHQAFRGEL